MSSISPSDRPREDERWPSPLRSLGAGLAFVVVAVAAQLLRQPGARTWNTIWAEDGPVFTHDALTHPALETLLRGYSAYASFVPRVIALGTRLVPPAWFAPYLATSAAFVTALLGLMVVRSARGWVTSSALRWSLGAMTVVAPVMFSEINAVVANVNWPFLIASFWAISSREEGRIDTSLRSATVLLGALTTATQAVMFPWAVAVAIYRRRRSDVVVLIALTVGLAVQAAAAAATESPVAPAGHDVTKLIEGFGARVLASLVLGERWWPDLVIHHRVLSLGSFAVIVVVVVLALTGPGRVDRDHRLLAAGAVVVGVAVFVSTVWVRGTSAVELFANGSIVLRSGRYEYVPVVLLYSAIVVLVDGAGRAWLRWLVLAQVAVVILTSLAVRPQRSHGPTWSTEVAAARQSCLSDPNLAAVSIPITPGPNWSFEISCDRLR